MKPLTKERIQELYILLKHYERLISSQQMTREDLKPAINTVMQELRGYEHR